MKAVSSWHERKAKKDRRREERSAKKRAPRTIYRSVHKRPTTDELDAALAKFMEERRAKEGAAVRFASRLVELADGKKILLVADSAGGTLILRGQQ